MDKSTALDAVVKVMDLGHDGRITQPCMDYYRGRPAEDQHIIKVAKLNGEPAGISAMQVERGFVKNAITVIAPEHRRKGIAQKLVQAVLAECKNKGVKFSCGIAEDNEPATALLAKFSSELPVARREQARRRSGEFTRVWYGEPAPEAELVIEGVDDKRDVVIEGSDDF